MTKVFRIDMSAGTVQNEEFREEYRLFGNRGLIAKVMTEETDPTCDPLGADNKLIVCTGLFAGRNVSTGNRLSIGGKSPLTGGIKEANAGGNVASLLAQHDIKMLIFEGKPEGDSWYILKINKEGQAELIDGNPYRGLGTYDLVDNLHAEYGDKIGVICVGPAGERLYPIASLQVTENGTGHPSRAAARGGLGAVAGSKHIKAIIVEKPSQNHKYDFADIERFEAARKSMNATLLAEDNQLVQGFRTVGTVVNTMVMGPSGIMPVYNFRASAYEPEKTAKCDVTAWLGKIAANKGKTGVACQPGCLISCSNCYNNDKGEYVTSGFEYETYALCGPNCGIDDLDVMCTLDRMCDDFGIDTIEAGATIALCMEAGKIAWGDGAAAIGLLKEMADNTDLGQILSRGTALAGKAMGVTRIPTVKGQAMAGYDPRNLKGIGVTYAVSPMGADHTAGLAAGDPEANIKKDGQLEFSGMIQNFAAIADNTMCLFAFFGITTNLAVIPELMAGVYGGEWDFEKVAAIGAQTLALEKAYNRVAGLTSADDKLPDFFYNEPSPLTNAVFDISSEEMAAAFG